jgi:ribosome recycling factor
MLEEIYEEVRRQMSNSIDALKRDLSGIRAGRASASLLDGIRIDYYGTPTPLNQLAAISIPEPRLIVVRPYEPNLIPDIEKAILADKNLGLNPSNDGAIIRLPIPELTGERRIELTKVARSRAEEGRVAVRHGRRDGLHLVDAAKNDGDIGEDEARSAQDHIQKLTDDFIKHVDEIIESKAKEIMEV